MKLSSRIAAIALVPALVFGAAACSSTSSSPSASPSAGGATPVGCATPTPSVTYVTTSLTAEEVTVTGEGAALTAEFPHPACASTLSSKDIKVGTGAEAKTGSTITANYYLASGLTGEKVQSSFGGQPFEAQLSLGGLIAGWVQGIPGMKAGGERVLVIPGSLAYPTGKGTILPNETLVFVIELVAVS